MSDGTTHPTIMITSGVDMMSGQDTVRFSMEPLKVDNFCLEGWTMSLPIYSIHDRSENRSRPGRLPWLLEPGLRILQEFMDAPAEVFCLPGEELPRVASLSLLVNGRDDRSPIQKWRQWLACQALQHYGEMEKVTWWHPTKDTLERMPGRAEKFARRMEYAE